MAPQGGTENGAGKKRKNPAKAPAAHPQKRRKGGAGGGAGAGAGGGAGSKKKKGGAAAAAAAARPRRVVAVNDLRWKAVPIPEMFGDAEGFFGLEEIEGVDIVRDGDTVQFVTTDPVMDDDDGSVFEGFDDAPANGDEPEEKQTETAKAAETKKSKKAKKDDSKAETQKTAAAAAAGTDKDKKAKKEKKTSAVQADQDLAKGSGGFSMLAAMGSDADADAGDEGADVAAWVPLGLSPPMLSCLARLGFAKPSAIQAAAIPEIVAGHDVIGKASTGSGKTLAFAIPIVERWLARNNESSGAEKKKKASSATTTATPLALIMSPTRELAHQITQHIKDLCAALPAGPYVCSVTGGLSVYKQQRQLEKADIVVCTPGRLWEVLSGSRPLLDAFQSIAFLVVDEADRLLSEGHFKEAEEILLALDRLETNEEEEDEGEGEGDGPREKPRQTLVFSATFNKGLQQKLAGKGRYDLMDEAQSMEHLLKRLNFREDVPKFIDVNPVSQMAERLREGLVECGSMEKDLYLYALLMLQPTRRTLVFTNSISSVRRLAPMLQNLNLPALPLHSQMPQKARLRSVERFTAVPPGRGSVLIATDVAARGLDIPGIDVVIHYHVPRTADNYVHRSGRTARADKAGLSVLLCAPEEVTSTRRLVAKIHASAADKADKAKRASKAEEEEEEGESGDEEESGDEGKPAAAAARPRPPKNGGTSYFIRTIDLDRRLVARLRERLVLAKRLADAALAKEKGSKDDNWLREAAEELGVDYDSEEDGALEGKGGHGGGGRRARDKAGSWSGRGSGRRSREDAARALTKAETGALRAELRQLLARRVNAGVSERYLTAGGVDVDALLRGAQGEFLGEVDGLGLED